MTAEQESWIRAYCAALTIGKDSASCELEADDCLVRFRRAFELYPKQEVNPRPLGKPTVGIR